ncbi:MAG: type III-A CRISPR-associated protein Cas10/Csm1 [Tissierellia bacterium]|nr:type III-A CRISPR-associated protein Cas10/Csm1 [Tissierellia bacterium]
MDDSKLRLIIGSALHDFGKIVYRSGDGRRHSLSGYEYLKDDCGIKDKAILDCIRFHHADELKSANLKPDNLAYISYIADNIASKADRRKCKNADEIGFDKDISLSSIFNILNDNKANKKYEAKYLNHDKGINMPVDDIKYNAEYYNEIKNNLQDKLKNIENTKEYIESLFEILEAYLTYIPSSTNLSEIQDISLYDHLKLTSAIATCIYDYFKEKELFDYSLLLKDSKLYYEKEIFYLYSLDFSGIQDFIYTIINSKALKSLRTRSFYLEIMMEEFIDTILDKLNLTRANLIYSGGGHAYLLLPNTENTKIIVEKMKNDINDWLVEIFGIELYLSGGGKAAKANDLENYPTGSYSNLFKSVSKEISKNKLSRYSVEQLKRLNFRDEESGSRECKICNRVDKLIENGEGDIICDICNEIIKFSRDILHKEFFAIVKDDFKTKKPSLVLPFGKKIIAYDEISLNKDMIGNSLIRIYSKNEMYLGKNISTNLWVGDYCYDKELRNLIDDSQGIKRLSVLRADIDNLGKAFVNGYKEEDKSLTRSATFSRQMSLFFKYHINYILDNPEFSLLDEKDIKRRKALIVYSGGDDVFVVGSWRDIIEFSVDLRRYLQEFTIDTLTISAGIGIYPETYPIKAMAENTGKLEEYAKKYKRKIKGRFVEKNAVCLFDKDLVFGWEELEQGIKNKIIILHDYLTKVDEIGKSLFYKIISYLKHIDDKINIARLAYLLARIDERLKLKDENKNFSRSIYRWAVDEVDRRQLIAAIYILIYMER